MNRATTEKTQSQIEDLQKTERVERAEKQEMGRLYNELLKQLKTAEEEKEKLQVGVRPAPINYYYYRNSTVPHGSIHPRLDSE